ncbi:MAG: tetratricopeptide repeat protein [Nitrospirae bacterium]|nr:tetratricopeptide repeat protein [Magnetococcales bacterium]HAT50030.1 hypothetical protein [Alphaproteobacteria bacterium]
MNVLPDDPSEAIHRKCRLGGLLVGQKNFDAALPLLEEVIAQDRTNLEAYLHLITIFIAKEWFVVARIVMRLLQHFDPQKTAIDHDVFDLDRVRDTFFLDPQKGRQVASQRKRVQQTRVVDAPQLCYHFGPKQQGDSDTVIAVEQGKETAPFFLFTRLRLPTFIDFDPDAIAQVNQAFQIGHLLEHVIGMRRSALRQALLAIKQQTPGNAANGPLRVFLSASRLTTVMAHCSRDLARTFQKKGCEVLFIMEENDREDLSGFHVYRAQASWNPHVTVNINHANHLWLNDHVRNIVWWQDDLMEELQKGVALPWRNHDLVLSIDGFLDRHVCKTGPKAIIRQNFCVDLDLFFPVIPPHERKKIIFVGSSYVKDRPSRESGIPYQILNLLEQWIVDGEKFDLSLMERVASQWQVSSKLVYSIMQFVIREHTVMWLCSLAGSLDYDVEIYGYGWENNRVVSPFFKGAAPHGPGLCAIYNQARYALAASIFLVHTQRLVEMAACGCIPVVFDQRSADEPQTWDDECLFFSSQETLRHCLTQTPQGDPMRIAQANSYDRAVEKILHWVRTGVYPDKPVYGSPADGALQNT